MRIRLGLAAALTVTATLTACDSGSGAADDPTDRSSPSASSTTPSSESSTESPTPSAEPTMTAPGTVLKYGETARLTLPGQGVIDLTVTRVEQGKPEHFRSDDSFDPSLDRAYYAHSEVEVVSVEGTGMSSNVLLVAMAATYGPGRQFHGGPIPTEGKHRQCDYPKEPIDAAPGDTFATCNALAIPKGEQLNGIAFDVDGTPYARFGGKPVYWRQ